MKITLLFIISFSIAIGFIGCTSSTQEQQDSITNGEKETSITRKEYCFLKAESKDTTTINLTVSNEKVTGTMSWQPYEKDGARGTLSGTTNAMGEFELLFDYTIEGSHQTETMVMKIEKGELLIKRGELIDPKNDGHLIFKDVTKAVYSELLGQVTCTSK